MINKRGQQASVGMSFGMIFSIFLIIVFIFTAVTVIFLFLDFIWTVNSGKFFESMQTDVNKAWRSSHTPGKEFKLNLDDEITHVCFMNISAPVTANQDLIKKITFNYRAGTNVYLIPPGSGKGIDKKHIEHLDIARITQNENPYCVKNPGKIVLSKCMKCPLVSVTEAEA